MHVRIVTAISAFGLLVAPAIAEDDKPENIFQKPEKGEAKADGKKKKKEMIAPVWALLLRYFDQNKDQMLDAGERKRGQESLKKVNARTPNPFSLQGEIWLQIDTDGDGKLTLEEQKQAAGLYVQRVGQLRAKQAQEYQKRLREMMQRARSGGGRGGRNNRGGNRNRGIFGGLPGYR